MIIRVSKDRFEVNLCSSLISQFVGLMFKFPRNDGILMDFKHESYISLHMFFVFFPIDIIYLDKNKKVVKIRKNVKPFVPYITAVKCSYILELKDCRNVKVGDKITNLKYPLNA